MKGDILKAIEDERIDCVKNIVSSKIAIKILKDEKQTDVVAYKNGAIVDGKQTKIPVTVQQVLREQENNLNAALKRYSAIEALRTEEEAVKE